MSDVPCQYYTLEKNIYYEVHETWCMCWTGNNWLWCPHLTLLDKRDGNSYHYGFIRTKNHTRRWKNANNYQYWVQDILYYWEDVRWGDSHMLCKRSIWDP